MIAVLFLAYFYDESNNIESLGNLWVLRAIGLLLLTAVLRASGVTGRYLRVYGGSKGGVPHKIVTIGPYSCMRHPMHFFLSLFPLSIAFLMASPHPLLISVIEMLLIQLMAVLVDEREAISRFGEDYLSYKKRTPAFNPSPRCLAKSLVKKPSLPNDYDSPKNISRPTKKRI